MDGVIVAAARAAGRNSTQVLLAAGWFDRPAVLLCPAVLLRRGWLQATGRTRAFAPDGLGLRGRWPG